MNRVRKSLIMNGWMFREFGCCPLSTVHCRLSSPVHGPNTRETSRQDFHEPPSPEGRVFDERFMIPMRGEATAKA